MTEDQIEQEHADGCHDDERQAYAALYCHVCEAELDDAVGSYRASLGLE